MEKKYRALRVIATITKIVAWIFLVLGVLGSCLYGASVLFLMGGTATRGTEFAGLLGGGILGAVIGIVSILFVVLFTFLPLYAFAELIDVMLALEENTRATAEQLKNITKA